MAAFYVADERLEHVASHLHSSWSLVRSIELHLPAVAIVRDPEAAVASLHLRSPLIAESGVLLAYIYFHWRLAHLVGKALILPFETAIDPAFDVVAAVNRFAGTAFHTVNPGMGREEAINARVEAMDAAEWGGVVNEMTVARPSNKRVTSRTLGETSRFTQFLLRIARRQYFSLADKGFERSAPRVGSDGE